MDDFDDAAQEIVDGLGTKFVYFDQENVRQITAIFSNPSQTVEGTRGPGVHSNRAELSVYRGVVAEPKKGDKVFCGPMKRFRGVYDYEVVKPRDDEERTMVTLVLKKV